MTFEGQDQGHAHAHSHHDYEHEFFPSPEDYSAPAEEHSRSGRPTSPSSPGQEAVTTLRLKYDEEKDRTNTIRSDCAAMMSAFLAAAEVTPDSPGAGFRAVDLSDVTPFVAAAVALNGLALSHASERLQNDRGAYSSDVLPDTE